MQPTENFSVPRRALDVEDYIDILRRHKGWIFGPFLLTLVASVVGVYLWPDSYESVAVVKIVPQQVPQNMVQSSITQDMTDRITSMATTVLSRNVLTTIINNFDLYPRERKRLPMEDVVENMMHEDVHINPDHGRGSNGRTVPAFTVQFSYENRLLANKVVQDLVARFIVGEPKQPFQCHHRDHPVSEGSGGAGQEGAGCAGREALPIPGTEYRPAARSSGHEHAAS